LLLFLLFLLLFFSFGFFLLFALLLPPILGVALVHLDPQLLVQPWFLLVFIIRLEARVLALALGVSYLAGVYCTPH